MSPYRKPDPPMIERGTRRVDGEWMGIGIFVALALLLAGGTGYAAKRSADAERAQRNSECGGYCDLRIADIPASCHRYCLEGAGSK